MINEKQCTIIWHVDDLNITILEKKYGKVNPLSVKRGKKHEYLGIDIDFSTPHKFNASMIPYIRRILEDAPDDIKGLATTPAADYLFKTRDTTKLDKKKPKYSTT
mmetsp:Transcript_2297/g.3328  ORF Transcript_2297/g.3328 Transcript_2297/m.3328 type:complete len:105 (-) Transcript_2297:3938-4252(-)